MSWMRLCQSVTASADIALFVGGREGRRGERVCGWRRGESEGRGGLERDMHKWGTDFFKGLRAPIEKVDREGFCSRDAYSSFVS